MKKISAVLLMAVLASSLVFAGFSGSATVGFGANFDNKNYGFSNTTSVKVDVNFFEQLGSKQVEEGGIFTSINGSLYLKFSNGDGSTKVEAPDWGKTSTTSFVPYVQAKIDSATIGGENWEVSLLGVAGIFDFAKSAVDTWDANDGANKWGYATADYTEKATWKLDYIKAAGVKAKVYGYEVNFGLAGVSGGKNDVFGKADLNVAVATPSISFADGLSFRVAGAYAQNAKTNADDPTKTLFQSAGGSVEVAYATDAVTVKAASDLGYDFKAKAFNADAALNVTTAPVVADVYYATNVKVNGVAKKDLLSAKAVVDLASFDVPVALTLTGKDLINVQDLSAKVSFSLAFDNESVLTLEPFGGYTINNKAWNAGMDVKYVMSVMTAKVSAKLSATAGAFDTTKALKLGASVESASIIPGATLKLEWKKGVNDIDVLNGKYGQVLASAKLAF